MKRPVIPGMKEMPLFVEDDPFMEGAFAACVRATLKMDDAVVEFEKETGTVPPRFAKNGLEAMIDAAVGYDSKADAMEYLAKFADWVAVNIWGVEQGSQL